MDQSRPDAVIPSEAPCDAWDQQDIQALVSLEPTGPLRYRSRYGDANLNGRSYGGQILGQAMMAATLSVPEDRQASALQLLFLSGPSPIGGSISKSGFFRKASGSPPGTSWAFRAMEKLC
jgi:acyl-CoA thioesterase II